MLGQDIAELMDEMNNDFSARHITCFLEESGLLEKGKKCRVEKCEKFIFLHGDSDEVYTATERKFIEELGYIFVFPDFFKKTNKGNMPCRFVAMDLSQSYDDVYAAVFFMKIVIKAIGGFTIFVMKFSDGVHLGMRLFDSTQDWKNCTLSEPGKLMDILDEVMLIEESDWFLKYYNTLVEAIKPTTEYIDYDERILKKRGIQFSYIDLLYELEHRYRESVQTELIRYRDFFEDEFSLKYAEILDETMEELKNIQSSKVNTIEMLFQADELERTTTEAETNRNKGVDILYDSRKTENNFSLIEEMKNSPEAVIKRLKSIRGLV